MITPRKSLAGCGDGTTRSAEAPVWRYSQRLSTELDPIVDRIAARKPSLAEQIDRCANAISANIAEACGRDSQADKRRILTIAMGESTELESHLIRARNALLLTPDEFEQLVGQVIRIRKMMYALRRSME